MADRSILVFHPALAGRPDRLALLREAGYNATVCTKGYNALRVLQKQPHRFALVGLDIQGLDLLRSAARSIPFTRGILLGDRITARTRESLQGQPLPTNVAALIVADGLQDLVSCLRKLDGDLFGVNAYQVDPGDSSTWRRTVAADGETGGVLAWLEEVVNRRARLGGTPARIAMEAAEKLLDHPLHGGLLPRKAKKEVTLAVWGGGAAITVEAPTAGCAEAALETLHLGSRASSISGVRGLERVVVNLKPGRTAQLIGLLPGDSSSPTRSAPPQLELFIERSEQCLLP